MSEITFERYRYQILPTVPVEQGLLFASRDELIANKNIFFADALKEVKEIAHRRQIRVAVTAEIDPWLLVTMAPEQRVTLGTREFTDREAENWPRVTIVIDNDPKSQLIWAQVNRRAFKNSGTAVNVLIKSVNDMLDARGIPLGVVEEPTFESNDFWDVVESNEAKILSVDFELVAPNLSDISGELSEELKDLMSATHSQVSHLELASDPNGALTLTRDNKVINGLVEYSANGGGKISLRIRGLASRITTSEQVTERSIEEIDIEGKPEDVLAQLRDLLE